MKIEGRAKGHNRGASLAADSKRRAQRELKTVGAMIALYCRHHHGMGREPCDDCQELEDYVLQRLQRCPLLVDKPTCVNCPVHCYQPAMRERIRAVMRYAGPRMMWRHPFLAILHLLDRRSDRERGGTAKKRAAPACGSKRGVCRGQGH